MGDPNRPASLGKYQLLKKLSTSPLAEIWVGKSVAPIAGVEQIVALKRVLPHHTQHVDFVRAFIEEARTAAILHHPNIVQIFDVATDGGELFLVMEYLSGENVSTLMAGLRERKIGLPLEQSLSIVIGAAAGLHHAHEKRGSEGKPLHIIHGDVTPENVFITYDGGVKVMDFGIARAGKRLAEVSEAGFKAKAPYLSPEQCKSEPVDRRSDVFALGIILYELTTGYRLFKGLTAVEIMQKIVEKSIELPTKRREGYPKELEAIVMKALERDREKRHATAQALQAEIEDFAREQQLAVSTITLTAFMQRVFGNTIEAAKKDPVTGKVAVSLPKPRPSAPAGPPPPKLPPLPSKRAVAPPPPYPPAPSAQPVPAGEPPTLDGDELDIVTDDLPSLRSLAAAAPSGSSAPVASSSSDASSSLALSIPTSRKTWMLAGAGAALLLAVTCAVLVGGGSDDKPAAAQAKNEPAAGSAPAAPAPAPAAPSPAAPAPAEEAAAPPALEAAPEPPGFLRVTTKPRGAAITVDGSEWREKTPAVVDGLAAGEHTVRVTHEGRLPREEVVTVSAGKTTRVAYDLEADPSLEPPPDRVAAAPRKEPRKEPRKASPPPEKEPTASTSPPPPSPPPAQSKPPSTGTPGQKFDAAAWRRRMWEKKK